MFWANACDPYCHFAQIDPCPGVRARGAGPSRADGAEPMSRPPFFFSRRSGLGPLPRLFEAAEGSRALTSLFAAAEIRLDGGGPESLVPFGALNEVFNRATRLSGDPLFPIRVAQTMQPEDYGPLVHFALQAETLRAGIRRIGRLGPLHSNATVFDFRDDGRASVWSLVYRDARGLRIEYHALHVLLPMINFIRRYAGPAARPTAIYLATPTHPSHGRLEVALEAPVRADADRFGIGFPSAWLALPGPRRAAPGVTLGGVMAHYRRDSLPRSTAETVAALLGPIVGISDIDLDAIAGKLNTSRRTLQQRLNAEGSNFRDIALGVRVKRAKELMLGGDAAIAQVALAVGYSDQAHFTRAFKTLTGLTPQEFRRLNRLGMMDAAE